MTEEFDLAPAEDAPAPVVDPYESDSYDDPVNETTTEQSSPPQSFARWLAETALLVIVAFLLAQGIKTFVVQPYVIPTGSMIPTILIEDRVIAEKMSYRFTDPVPGDIVVLDDPDGRHPQLIKRVIAVGGQTIDIHDGRVYVDGVELNEPYIHGAITELGTVSMPLTLADDELFVMGDNRPNSGDARFFGPVPVSSVKGKAIAIYWPLDRIGAL